MNWDIINPGTWIRLWTVEGCNWHGGRSESFWLKRNALRAIDGFLESYIFVYLICEFTGETVCLKNNPNNLEFPTYV